MAGMHRAHSQTPILPLSSSLYLHPLKNDRSSEFKQNSKRKLEDYLDPVLLQTISSKISQTEMKEKQFVKKNVFVTTNQINEFDWPVDRLDPLINDPNRDTTRYYKEEDDGSRLTGVEAIPSLSKRRRSNFPIWKVNDSKNSAVQQAGKHGAA